jgi:hypothetical protein
MHAEFFVDPIGTKNMNLNNEKARNEHYKTMNNHLNRIDES